MSHNTNPQVPDSEALRIEITDILIRATGRKYLTKASRTGIEDTMQVVAKAVDAACLDELSKLAGCRYGMTLAVRETIDARIAELQSKATLSTSEEQE